MNFFLLGGVFLTFTIVADAGLMWSIIRSGTFNESWRMLRGTVS
jgi:hypothetical protein